MVRICVLVVVLGCGGSSAAPGDAPGDVPSFAEQSGTRLKRRGHIVDGTKALDRLHDAQRDEPCRAIGWTDGQTYCTPFEQTGTVVYLDAACTQPVGLASTNDCAGPARYFVEYAAEECAANIQRLFTAGATRAETTYYLRSGASCTQSSIYPAYEELRSLGAEVPASAFVPLTLSAPIGAHRLRQRFYESADGLRFAASLDDAELDETCNVIGTSELACFPAGTLDASMYSDASCTQRVAVKPGACGTPRFAAASAKPFCAFQPYELFRLGAALPSATLYRPDAQNTCGPVGLEDRPQFALGERLAPATVTPVYDGPSARVQLTYHASGEDRFPARVLFDHEANSPCFAQRAEDGVLRCLPMARPSTHYFTNATCTSGIDLVRVYVGPAGCSAPPKPAYAREPIGQDPCTAASRISPIGAEYTGPLYSNAGLCEPASRANVVFYEVGGALPATRFLAAEPITE